MSILFDQNYIHHSDRGRVYDHSSHTLSIQGYTDWGEFRDAPSYLLHVPPLSGVSERGDA